MDLRWFKLGIDDSDRRAMRTRSDDLRGMETHDVGNGRSLASYWRTPRFVMWNEHEQDRLGVNCLSPVISHRLRCDLEGLGVTDVEYYPVEVAHEDGRPMGTYWHLNVLLLPDVLDMQASIYTWADLGKFGTHMILIKPVLRAAVAEGRDFFRIPQSIGGVYVSQRVRDLCVRKKYTGMKFYEQRMS